jgi:hypothetical protein
VNDPDHKLTLLDSYTPAEIRTMEPGEEMRHLLAGGEAFEGLEPDAGKLALDDAAERILEHVDAQDLKPGGPASAALEFNGQRFEVAASHYCPEGAPPPEELANGMVNDAYLAVCRCYLRLLKAGAERGESDLRGMAEREAMTDIKGGGDRE